MDVHRIGELESLEVRERHDRCGWSKVLDLLEFAHNLRPHDASVLINQLNWRTLTIVSNAVTDQHIELVLVVLDGQHHSHGLTDFHDTRNFRSPRTLTDLNLHPALEIVTQEVRSHSMEHVDLERTERDGLLVEIVPRTTQLTSLKSSRSLSDKPIETC